MSENDNFPLFWGSSPESVFLTSSDEICLGGARGGGSERENGERVVWVRVGFLVIVKAGGAKQRKCSIINDNHLNQKLIGGLWFGFCKGGPP